MNVTLIDVPSKFKVCELFNAIVFYGEKLMSKRMLAGIDLRVVFVKGLENDENIVADCGWEDSNTRPREFMLRVDADMGKARAFTAIAHEMVHVKQYATGELRDMIKCDHTRWQKQTFVMEDHDYWDLPWEIEAHGREAGLYTRFKVYWYKESRNAKAAFEAQPDSAGTAHTLVCKKGCKE